MKKIRSLANRPFPLISLTLSLALFAGSGPTPAQAPNRTATKFYPDFSDTADALLRNAASHARDHQWAEAIEIYQRVIQQYGDKVAKLPREEAGEGAAESVLFVDLRQFCQRRLAALPPEARAVYRGRVDAQAERWYRRGLAERDRASLRRVVEQAFCSSWGDDALDLLGDLAFEDGRFDEALSMFRRLVPDRPDDRSGLIYPDPSVDPAKVAAKKLLCRAAKGEPPDASALEAFAKAYPNASGKLAGRTGRFATILADALRADHLSPPSQPDGRWPTFAGATTRTKVVPGTIDVGSLQWRVELTPFDPNKGGPMMRSGFRAGMGGMSPVTIPKDRLLSYHPIVLGDQVIVCDENRIRAYNLNDRPEGPMGTVKPVWEAPPENQDGSNTQAVVPFAAVPRYTLTAFGDRIYARMGPTTSRFVLGMGGPRGPSPSKIVAVDRGTEGKVLWTKPSGEVVLPKHAADNTSRLGFEGTPVADARSVYVAMTDRREQTATYVACLDADNGATRWIRYLGAASSDDDNMNGFNFGGMGMSPHSSDFGHRLLTLDGPTLYYQTNLGAIAALDAETGGIRWVATYPRQDRNEGGGGHDRDLNPAIVHDGLVIVAPDDAPCIYAFDAESGRLAWKTETIPGEVKLAHLLGVARGKLVATGDRVLLFDVATGKLTSSWPDSGHVYEGFGRGLLAGDRIYWPTQNEIHILDQSSGLRAEAPIKLQETFQTSGGNLAVGDGYLIVAQSDALVVFCQNSRLIQRYRDEIARNPDDAVNYYRLAQAAEATGRDEEALKALGEAARKVRPSDTIDGVSLADATRDQQFRLLMRLGRASRASKDWARAVERFREAAGLARADRDRLGARFLLADVQLERDTPREAVETLQGLLADDRLRHLSVVAEDGRRTIRADLLISDRLDAILRKYDRTLYAGFDREAKTLLERGEAANDPRLLEEVGRSYPAAEVVPESLLALGRMRERAKLPADAAHAYKRLLVHAPSDGLRAQALWGLARAYEAQKLWVPARDTYVEALSRFGNLPIDRPEGAVRLATLVSERLAREPFDRMTGDRSEPSLRIPLARRWGQSLSGPVRPLAADGVPPSGEASRFFLAQGPSLRSIEPGTGASPWGAELGGSPVWAGYLADKLIAATETRVVGVQLDGGKIAWSHDLGGAPKGARGTNPFAKPEADTPDSAQGRFHGFQIVGNRVFCLRGERELLALDGDTGLLDWSYSPTTAAINPLLRIGPQRIVLQVRKPNAVVVLATDDGRRIFEHPQPGDEEWARAPLPIDDDHVALVPDRRSVALFDLRRGTPSWVFHESRELPKNGPPRLLGNAERLVVVHDGTELIRLDLATGQKRWAFPLGSENLGDRPEAMAMDGDRFYWASDRMLRAASLADGKLAWSRHLAGPESGWSLALTDRYVLAYPTIAGLIDGEEGTEGLPLVFRRRDTGALVQRLLFPTAAAEVAVRLTPGGAMVATSSGLWSLGERRAPEIAKASP